MRDTPKRALILSASAGFGHLRAADALEKSFHELFPDDEVRNHDALDFAPPAFKKMYGGSYLAMVNHTPFLWGYLYSYYNRSDEESQITKLSRVISRVNAGKLVAFVKEFCPHVILCTHFFPAEVLAKSKKKGEFNAKIVMSITDYDLHAFWVQKSVDHYFAPNDEVAYMLTQRGVPEEAVSVTGIPVDPVFGESSEPHTAQKELQLHSDKPTVLLLKGGFGVGGADEVGKALLDTEKGIQLVAIAGKNPGLKVKFEALEVPPGSALRVLGFVDNMQDYMGAANLVVTKSGGLTVSECLAKGVPMIITDPIPGQEDRNCDYLLESGAALKATGLPALQYRVKCLLDEPGRLLRMKDAVRKIARPRAAFEIAEIARKLSSE